MDTRTILLIAFINQLIVAIVLFVLWKSNKKRVKGLGEWTLNLWMQTIGHILLTTVGILPLFFAEILPSVFFITGSVVFYFGLAKFTDTPYRKKSFIIYVLAMISALVFFSYILPNIQMRALLFSCACVYISIRYLLIFFKNLKSNRFYTKAFFVLILLYIAFAASYFIRIILILLGIVGPSTNLGVPSMVMSSRILFSMIVLMGVNFTILILINNSLMSALANQSYEKTKLLTQMKILAEHDSLTGIMNRMAIENCLENILAANQKTMGRCMVQLIDVDDFKKINDAYGHEIGDQVLTQLARIFSQKIRNVDQVGRWGGDEFVLVFHDIDEKSIKPMVKRIQQAVRDYDWKTIIPNEHAKVSISIGYTMCDSKESMRTILKRADDFLYSSKENGRDCAVGD